MDHTQKKTFPLSAIVLSLSRPECYRHCNTFVVKVSKMKRACIEMDNVLPLILLEFSVFYSRCSSLSWVDLLLRGACNLSFTLEGA